MDKTAAYEEAATLFRLAAPSFVTTMCMFALTMIEMMVAGHVGTTEMTAIAFSQIVLDFSLNFITQGFDKGLNSLASQAFGAKNHTLLGRYVQMACLIVTALCVPLGVFWWFVGDLLPYFGVSAASVVLARQYAHLSVLWLWPRIMFQLLVVYFQSQQIFLPTAVISLAFLVVHIVLNLVLVFGVPALHIRGMGFLGMPLAMCLTIYLRLAIYVGYMFGRKRHHARSWCWTWDFLQAKYSRKLIAVGLPLAIGRLFEDVQFQLMALMASWAGEIALDSHNCMIELYFVVTSVILGLTKAGVARIGMYLGAGQPKQAKATSDLLLYIIAGLAAVISLGFVLGRNYVGHLFSTDPRIWDTMAAVATLTGGGYLIMALFYSAMSTLLAQARGLPILVAFFTGAWIIGIPGAYLAGIYYEMGLLGIWLGMCTGYGATSIIALYASCRTDWDQEAIKAVERSKHAADELIAPDEATTLLP
ncbi:Aste57867_14255 [Aphanomyces stellatus]|uniref:Aste57867_14255 protein n=1 Tax=Aphanomyces stellatus TaxID=120398 RepID=A0A485L0I1_9STRA|nr:hypothetical protein As57867_014204 [Aphanomyces stellatus]VFT91080.1 Aste57867_14255 [Aphanomyces stellatus]